MNARQQRFIDAFVATGNASEAARQAGYSSKAPGQIGEKLLKIPEIAAAIAARQAELAQGMQITAERVLRERARLAFMDPGKLFDTEGNPRPITDLDDDARACIAAIEVVERPGPGGMVRTITKYRLHDKAASLTALEKRLGLNEKPIGFNLPSVGDVPGVTLAQADIAQAVARGELLASEGAALSALVENQRRGLETTLLEQRIAALEERLAKPA